MATVSTSNAYATTATRALSYITERAEDAQAALQGILGGTGPGAGGGSGADRYLGAVDLASGEQGVKSTRTKLESSVEQERLDGLRTVVAMISKSLPASEHLFPSVLKLTSAQSLQVKTLVYLVTLRLAPSQPDVALLSINSFQRDLSDSSPLIRGMALRVLSGLGVKMAVPLMEMAIAKGTRDPSFYVRRIAADAVGKCYELASSSLPSLLPHLTTLLSDRHPSVLGSALLAFNCTLPYRLDLLHAHFRRICHALVDIDEWNQPVSLRILVAYARTYLQRPSAEAAQAVLVGKPEKVIPGRSKWGTELDKDLELLLSKTEPLLSSRNSACVLSAAHLYLTLLPIVSPRQQDVVQPLLRLLRGHPSQAYVALLFVRRLICLRSELFHSSTRAFLPLTSVSHEPVYITEQKLEILVDLAICKPTPSSVKFTKSELDNAALHRSESSIAICAVRGLGKLATSIPPSHSQGVPSQLVEECTETLLGVLKGRSGNKLGDRVVPACVAVLRVLITARAERPFESNTAAVEAATSAHVLNRLSSLLFKADDKPLGPSHAETSSSTSSVALLGKSSIADASGRASIYWLLGHYCRQEIKVVRRESSTTEGDGESKTLAEVTLPDVLRKGCLNFGKEPAQAKMALLTLSAKLHAFLPTTSAQTSVIKKVAQLHTYVLQLGRYDASYDVRDRARYYRNLTAGIDADLGNGVNGGTPLELHNGTDGDGEDQNTPYPVLPPGGVRLRREQVLLILFGDKVSSLGGPSQDHVAPSFLAPKVKAPLDPGHYLDPLQLFDAHRSGNGHCEQPADQEDYEGALPAWTSDQSQLPPATVREPIALPSNPNAARSLSSSNAQPVASAAAYDSPSSLSPATSPPTVTRISRGPSSAKVRLTASASASAGEVGGGSTSSRTSSSLPPLVGGGGAAAGLQQGKGKYKDLDTFLDEASEEEEDSTSSEEEEEGEEEQESSDEAGEDDQADSLAGSEEGESESESSEEDVSEEERVDLQQAVTRPLLSPHNEWAT